MSETATLDSIEATYGYLRRPGDASVLVDNAAAFTRHAAWALRDKGWGNVRKTTGLQRQNLDVDKILNRHTLEMVDIVAAAGDPSQRVAWQPQVRGTLDMFVEPQKPEGVDGGPGTPVPVPVEGTAAIVDELKALRASVEAHHETSKAILDILNRAAQRFGV